MPKILIRQKTSRPHVKQGGVLSGQTLFSKLLEGSSPKTLIISCSDPLSMPPVLSDSPGECSLMLQTPGALIPPYQRVTSNLEVFATLEYAIIYFGVEHVVVIGHHNCSAIDSFSKILTVAPANQPGMICVESKNNVNIAAEKEQSTDVGKWAVQLTRNNLLSNPAIDTRVRASNLWIHTWYFEAHNNYIDFMDAN